MGLADRISSSKEDLVSTRTTKCRVKILLELLEPSERDALQEVLSDMNNVGTKILNDIIMPEADELAELAKSKKGAERKRLDELVHAFRAITWDGLQRHRRSADSCGRDNA